MEKKKKKKERQKWIKKGKEKKKKKEKQEIHNRKDNEVGKDKSSASKKREIWVNQIPVNRILSTPSSAKIFDILMISVVVNKFSVGWSSTPSSGIQYVQRKLHLSVKEILK